MVFYRYYDIVETLQEIRAIRNCKLAQDLMTKLSVLLEQEKAKIETNTAHMCRCWINLNEQIEQGKAKTGDIILQLRHIKELLTKLPASKRVEMEACFSSLCAEAYTIVNKITDDMKIRCDMFRQAISMCILMSLLQHHTRLLSKFLTS